MTERDTSQLTNAANLLGSNITGGQVEVQSHTSNEGDPDVNFLLTQDRSEAIVSYLVGQGVDPAALVAQGYGASQPIADNSTAEGRAENERVVLTVKEG